LPKEHCCYIPKGLIPEFHHQLPESLFAIAPLLQSSPPFKLRGTLRYAFFLVSFIPQILDLGNLKKSILYFLIDLSDTDCHHLANQVLLKYKSIQFNLLISR